MRAAALVGELGDVDELEHEVDESDHAYPRPPEPVSAALEATH
jgi:hypothetical protein